MKTVADIAAFIEQQPQMVELLEAVERLGLPDSWIGAGFIRNSVWDALSGNIDPLPLNDVDVIYFDGHDTSKDRDALIEASLSQTNPGIPWSVTNQARMHRRNGDAPYLDTADAIRHWPETATAVAARSINGRVELLVPFGVDDLVGMVIRPTLAFAERLEIVRERIAAKGWFTRWPGLKVLDMADDSMGCQTIGGGSLPTGPHSLCKNKG